MSGFPRILTQLLIFLYNPPYFTRLLIQHNLSYPQKQEFYLVNGEETRGIPKNNTDSHIPVKVFCFVNERNEVTQLGLFTRKLEQTPNYHKHWNKMTPNKLYTLVFVADASRILLGMKKRGFGVGRWNGFGGKVDPGESIEAAAKRWGVGYFMYMGGRCNRFGLEWPDSWCGSTVSQGVAPLLLGLSLVNL